MKSLLCKKTEGYFLNEEDFSVIMKFNSNKELEPEYRIQTQLLPEPFIGNPLNAKVLLLALNPGYSGSNKKELVSEDYLHTTADFIKLVEDNLMLKDVKYPFYYLNESNVFDKSPGHKFWRKRILRQLIENENISCDHLSKNICCFQYHGYHSTKYKYLGETIESQKFTIKTIQTFIERNIENVPIVIMRSLKLWKDLIPSLSDIEKDIIVLKNPRNPVISKNNMRDDQYDRIVNIIKYQCQ